MTLDEAIKHCLEVAEECDLAAGTYKILAENSHNVFENMTAEAHSSQCAKHTTYHKQLAEWLKELKDRREENKVLISECHRLIKEKGELLKKVGQMTEHERLLKAALEDLRLVRKCQFCKHQITGYADICYGCHYNTNKWEWRYADEVKKLLKNVEE